ncbi:MAG: hypothetical protein WAS36_04365 [Candidatus Saccharimonadales bacterium]
MSEAVFQVGIKALIRNAKGEILLTISNKRIPTPTVHYRLLLVIYSIELQTEQTLKSNEEGREIAWVSPKEAAVHLADKFPSDFCDKIALLA